MAHSRPAETVRTGMTLIKLIFDEQKTCYPSVLYATQNAFLILNS